MRYIYAAILSSLSLIHVSAKESDSNFYIVGEAGVGVINKVSIDERQYKRIKNIEPEGYKMKFLKAHVGDIGDIGIGYKINNFRFDVKVRHCFTDNHYYSHNTNENGGIKDITSSTGIKKSINYYSKDIKMQMQDLDISINTYYDFPIEFKNIRPFILGGYGISNKKIKFIENSIFSASNPSNISDIYIKSDEEKIQSYKSKSNPFYTLGLGLSYDLNPVVFDLTYKFKKNLRDNFKDDEGNNYKIKSQSHYLMMGIRYHF